MKKLISVLLILTMVIALAACGNKTTSKNDKPEVEVENQLNETGKDESIDEEKNTESKEDEKAEKSVENKPAENKPTEKPAENKPTENKPAEKPVENKPAEKPAETPKTIGSALLADFKAKASGMGTEALANALLANPVIKFKGVTAPAEEGLLSGFSNNEIKGFKSGTLFAPMIGSIPFVGYIFELENGADTAAFISDLRSKANLAWNVCVEADEMVTGSVGNKVFFVMCPKDFEE